MTRGKSSGIFALRQAWVCAASFEAVRGGRGTAGPRPVLLGSCTVSTRRAAPRGRFPRALRLAALTFGPCRIAPATLRPPTRGGHDGIKLTSAVRTPSARGEQAGRIHPCPRGPPDFPSPGLHRSTTARRRRGAWIRRPPHRRDRGIMRPVSGVRRRRGLATAHVVDRAED